MAVVFHQERWLVVSICLRHDSAWFFWFKKVISVKALKAWHDSNKLSCSLDGLSRPTSPCFSYRFHSAGVWKGGTLKDAGDTCGKKGPLPLSDRAFGGLHGYILRLMTIYRCKEILLLTSWWDEGSGESVNCQIYSREGQQIGRNCCRLLAMWKLAGSSAVAWPPK